MEKGGRFSLETQSKAGTYTFQYTIKEPPTEDGSLFMFYSPLFFPKSQPATIGVPGLPSSPIGVYLNSIFAKLKLTLSVGGDPALPSSMKSSTKTSKNETRMNSFPSPFTPMRMADGCFLPSNAARMRRGDALSSSFVIVNG